MGTAFKEKWEDVIAEQPAPEYFTGVLRYPYAEFREKALTENSALVDEFVEAIYGGKVVVLDDAFTREEVMKFKQACVQFSRDNSDSPTQRIIQNCPDYHQIFDTTMKPIDGYEAVDRSYYFFPWNGDPLGVIQRVKSHWDLSKIVNGLEPEDFTSNTPEDGIIDRLHIKHYPRGCGRISTHTDPVIALRMITAVHITQQGIDYSEGSYYAIDEEGTRHYLDSALRSGCMVMFYPRLPHGVTTVDPDAEVDWDSPEGRWFMLLFNPQSHLVENRKTAISLPG